MKKNNLMMLCASLFVYAMWVFYFCAPVHLEETLLFGVSFVILLVAYVCVYLRNITSKHSGAKWYVSDIILLVDVSIPFLFATFGTSATDYIGNTLIVACCGLNILLMLFALACAIYSKYVKKEQLQLSVLGILNLVMIWYMPFMFNHFVELNI